MQLMLDRAARGNADSLPDFLYNFYLHMYGVRKLAEQNLVALLLSCKEYCGSYTRLATFCQVCGIINDPPPSAEADAEMVSDAEMVGPRLTQCTHSSLHAFTLLTVACALCVVQVCNMYYELHLSLTQYHATAQLT
jgi:hypothetical protein